MPREKPERPADKAVRRANLRRIGRLFRAYWPKLCVVTVLIVFASVLGVIPAFLQRAVFTQAFTTDGRTSRSSSTAAADRARRRR